jgi:hypothetical protein
MFSPLRSAVETLWKLFMQMPGGQNRGADPSRLRGKVVCKLLNANGLFVMADRSLINRPVGWGVPRFGHLHRFAAQGVRMSTALGADATHFTC